MTLIESRTDGDPTDPCFEDVIVIDPSDLSIDRGSLLAALGYPSSERASNRLQSALPRLIQDAMVHAKPRAIAKLCEIVIAAQSDVIVKGGPAFHGRTLSMAMELASKAAVFAVTLGGEISSWIEKTSERDIWAGFIADAIASELTEASADLLQDSINRVMARRNLFGTVRYSPGYCDWPIDEMPALLSYIGSTRIDVITTGGGMMAPRKSICGMIGLTDDQESAAFNPCGICSRDDCPHRR